MIILQLLPVIICLLVLAAHFLRDGNLIAVLVLLVLCSLLGVRKRVVAWIIQGALVLGTIEWVLTLSELVQLRVATGEPYVRMVLILSGVALCTLASLLIFRLHSVQSWFRISSD